MSVPLPPPLPPLASPDDVAARLPRELSDEEYARLDILLADASAMIRTFCRNPFTAQRGTQRLRPIGTVVRLPRRPVAGVHGVVLILRDMRLPVAGYLWDGLDELHLADPGLVINLPELAYDYLDQYDLVAEVDYTAGYPQTPPDVLSVVCTMVNRALSMPGMGGMGGIVSEAVGEYTYKLSDAVATAGPLFLSEAEKAVLRTYRPASTLIELRS